MSDAFLCFCRFVFSGIFIQENTTNWVNMAAATVLGLIPVLILFLSFQKTFIAGMTSGAVKA